MDLLEKENGAGLRGKWGVFGAHEQNKLPASERRFQRCLRGSDADPEAFWQGMEGQPIYTKNKDVISRERTIPIGLHGDGAPTNKVESLFTISWSSVTARGATKHTHFIYAAINKSQIGEGTLEELWDYLAWSFNALTTGRLPDCDWKGRKIKGAGRVLARGWRASVINLRGDWEFFNQVLNFPMSTAKPHCCWLCSAGPDTAGLEWSEFGEGAGWRPTVRDHEKYLADLAASGKLLPGLFKIRTLRLEGVCIDVLHAIDQGVASHLSGNILAEVMEQGQWGAIKKEQIAGLQADLHRWYVANKKKYRIQGKLTWDRIKTSGDWPKLKAKAACTRHLSKYCATLARRFNSGSTHDKRRLALAELLDRFRASVIQQGGRVAVDVCSCRVHNCFAM
jgi:hypothetical protein